MWRHIIREPFNLLHLMFLASYFSSYISLSLSSTVQIANILKWKDDFIGGKTVEVWCLSTEVKRGFNFPFRFIYGQTVTKCRICIPCDILNLFKKTSSCHSYTTTASASGNICVNSSDLELYKLYFARFAAKLWNEIPCHIRHLSENKFKQTLRKLLFDILNSDETTLIRPP